MENNLLSPRPAQGPLFGPAFEKGWNRPLQIDHPPEADTGLSPAAVINAAQLYSGALQETIARFSPPPAEDGRGSDTGYMSGPHPDILGHVLQRADVRSRVHALEEQAAEKARHPANGLAFQPRAVVRVSNAHGLIEGHFRYMLMHMPAGAPATSAAQSQARLRTIDPLLVPVAAMTGPRKKQEQNEQRLALHAALKQNEMLDGTPGACGVRAKLDAMLAAVSVAALGARMMVDGPFGRQNPFAGQGRGRRNQKRRPGIQRASNAASLIVGARQAAAEASLRRRAALALDSGQPVADTAWQEDIGSLRPETIRAVEPAHEDLAFEA